MIVYDEINYKNILDNFNNQITNNKNQINKIKKSCIIYFCILLATILATTGFIYYTINLSSVITVILIAIVAIICVLLILFLMASLASNISYKNKLIFDLEEILNISPKLATNNNINSMKNNAMLINSSGLMSNKVLNERIKFVDLLKDNKIESIKYDKGAISIEYYINNELKIFEIACDLVFYEVLDAAELLIGNNNVILKLEYDKYFPKRNNLIDLTNESKEIIIKGESALC